MFKMKHQIFLAKMEYYFVTIRYSKSAESTKKIMVFSQNVLSKQVIYALKSNFTKLEVW